VPAAVVRVIRRDVAEAIITPFSGRPLVALSALAPTAGMTLMRMAGAVELSRQVAERLAASK
jgi:hypothetical protein